MQKQNVMFIVSMSNTMSSLWPPPIEMGIMDDGTVLADKQKRTEIFASRWKICADIIRLMLNQTSGCGVDVAIGKSTDLGVSMTRGNSDDKLQPILNVVEAISKTTKANEEANAEYAIREIVKMMNSDYEKKRVHWFVDAEMFINIDSDLCERKYPRDTVTLYVIGQLSTLHREFESAKHVTSRLVYNGVDVRFLVCRSDLNELEFQILSQKPYETMENSAIFKFANKKFEVKLLQTHPVDKPDWPIKSLRFLGFLPEIELCRIGFSEQKSTPERQVPMTTESENGERLLAVIGDHMLSDHKKPRVALLKWRGEEKKTRGYCIIVASEEKKTEISLSLIRLDRSKYKRLTRSLVLVDEIDEAATPLPDATYKAVAPQELWAIKRRYAEIEKMKSPAAKRRKLDTFSNEYNYLEAKDTFLTTTATWRNQSMGVRETKRDGNNNVDD
ncbi:hypothetical protein B9Z55_020638 [Caenorhabditis nigoni]|uniref:Uncharacterized protein n=1 Tax=Caenorhabditis nigoni TaxID=1611254 RepID=A0A2G5TNH5_9PELO|nr:hypothetical protein B9Z55_020638 [Caenorhabditis nigoni]